MKRPTGIANGSIGYTLSAVDVERSIVAELADLEWLKSLADTAKARGELGPLHQLAMSSVVSTSSDEGSHSMFMPAHLQSLPFRFRRDETAAEIDEEPIRLSRFESLCETSTDIAFVGTSVAAIAWRPGYASRRCHNAAKTTLRSDAQVIALSTNGTNPAARGAHMIQLWEFASTHAPSTSAASDAPPRLIGAICHRYGVIRALRFCPLPLMLDDGPSKSLALMIGVGDTGHILVWLIDFTNHFADSMTLTTAEERLPTRFLELTPLIVGRTPALDASTDAERVDNDRGIALRAAASCIDWDPTFPFERVVVGADGGM